MVGVDRDTVRARIERMLNELDAIEEALPPSLETYLDPAQEMQRYALEHRLLVAIQAMLDVATHVAAASDSRGLDSYADAVRALVGLGVVSSSTASALAGGPGMRNAIVHAYLELDHARVFEALSATEDMRRFAREVWDWVETR